MSKTTLNETNMPDGWAAYGRLLTYVWSYWLPFAISIVGFLLYALTQAAWAGLMEFIPVAFWVKRPALVISLW